MARSAATIAILNAGKAKIEDTLDETLDAASDRFGVLLQNIVDGKLDISVLDTFNEFADNPTAALKAPAGSTDPTTAPGAIGGTPAEDDLSIALRHLSQSNKVLPEQVAAIKRLFLPATDPNRLAVDATGTPEEVTALKATITTLEKERKTNEAQITAAKKFDLDKVRPMLAAASTILVSKKKEFGNGDDFKFTAKLTPASVKDLEEGIEMLGKAIGV